MLNHTGGTCSHSGMIDYPRFTIHATVERFHFVFLLHKFRSRLSKQVISISIKKRSRNIYQVGESENRFTTS